MLDAPHVDDDELFSPLISLVLDGIGARLADVKPLPARKPAKARPRQPKKTSASA
jgi:hypothetical protein